ncbi:biotin--[acetyl-CoA-carboxylase] ligase [bacterium]|nr:biotin--[acetyl-CoA-carboxylase] ligase [bacterium]
MSRQPEQEATFQAAMRGGWGHPLEYHDELESTQDRLLQLAHHGDSVGACVVADHQAGGRGQHGRLWQVKPGQGLLFSLLLRPQLPAAELGGLPPLVASLALLRSLSPLELDLSLRWPNDLYAGPRKLAGLLMEGRIEGENYRHIALGIGLNLGQARIDFPPELCDRAVSLHQLLGQVPLPQDILAGFLIEMETLWTRLEAGEGSALVREWKRHWPDAKRVVRTTDGLGQAMDVNDQGALVLIKNTGEHHLYDSNSILSWEGP